MRPEYEKPVAMPLGETARGSGQCNEGSAVMPGLVGTGCGQGFTASSCGPGSGATPYCTGGTGATDKDCGYGSGGYSGAGCSPGYSPHCSTGNIAV